MPQLSAHSREARDLHTRSNSQESLSHGFLFVTGWTSNFGLGPFSGDGQYGCPLTICMGAKLAEYSSSNYGASSWGASPGFGLTMN